MQTWSCITIGDSDCCHSPNTIHTFDMVGKNYY
jgi:hypothetical protein